MHFPKPGRRSLTVLGLSVLAFLGIRGARKILREQNETELRKDRFQAAARQGTPFQAVQEDDEPLRRAANDDPQV